MANKLKDMEISSTDLCGWGANPLADIKLFKSAAHVEGGENDNMGEDKSLFEKFARFMAGELAKAVEVPITKSAGTEQVRATTTALQKSLESIIADDSLTAVEKHDMMADSLQAFTLEATDLMDGWAAARGVVKAEEDPEEPEEDPEDEEEEEDEEPGEEPEEVEKGVFDMATIQIEKMSPEDRATLEALEKKYAPVADEPAPEIHPEVQKAIDEVAELRKSLEMEKMTSFAKQYEIIGKKAEDLAPKLYEMKKSSEQAYNDYVALLDEQVAMQGSGIFKEFGTNRGGSATDLEATVAEIRKAEPGLTREQAICKAYEQNPALDPFTGKAM